MNFKSTLKALTLIGILLALFFFGRELLLELDAIRNYLQQTPKYYGLLLWIVYLIFTVVGLPVSPLTVLAGSVYGFWYGFALMVGALFPALFGVTWGVRLFFREPIRAFIQSKSSLERFLKLVDTGSERIHFLLRISGFTPFALVTYMMALSKKSTLKLVWVAVLGTVPHKALQVYMGFLGGKIISGEGVSLFSWLLGVLAFISVCGVVYLTRKELIALEGTSLDKA